MVLEIVFITIGIVAVALGYLLPARKDEKNSNAESFSREQVKTMVAEEVETAKGQITDIVDETINYAMEKTERSMDRLSNEKMMAVSEYSDTVLDQINKNHEEVVFLYDMLNDKHENLKDTVAEASKAVSEVKESIKQAEDFSPVVVERVVEKEPEPDVAPETKKSAKKTRKKNSDANTIKPVPVIKAVKPIVVEPEPEIEDNYEEDILEEEWDDFDADDFDEDIEDIDGPMISFNARTPGSRNSNERILELHKEGKSNMAIAKELGLGVGEVNLVIDLFKRSN